MKTVERTIIDIIADHIIWHRVVTAIETASAAFNQKKGEPTFWAEEHYTGYIAAINLLEIKDDELACHLGACVSDLIKQDGDADKLAERIYIEMLVEIKNFHVEKLA